jgi:hypothetical protein
MRKAPATFFVFGFADLGGSFNAFRNNFVHNSIIVCAADDLDLPHGFCFVHLLGTICFGTLIRFANRFFDFARNFIHRDTGLDFHRRFDEAHALGIPGSALARSFRRDRFPFLGIGCLLIALLAPWYEPNN